MILPGHDPRAIAHAAQLLHAGELLGLPTETVYGLAANADNTEAIARIYAAKGRPADHPLIVHIANTAAVPHYARAVPLFAHRLMQAFWPGPLTLILPRLPHAAHAAAGGQDSIGLRCPAHPVAQTLLHACAELPQPIHGIAAPSANRFGRVSPTTAQHVADELGPSLTILDGGSCSVGIESTIIDCTRGMPVLLRPGAITRDDIAHACGERPLSRDELAAHTPRASGTLLAHYAPRASVRLMDADTLHTALHTTGPTTGANAPTAITIYHRSPMAASALPPGTTLYPMPATAIEAARVLFSDLRDFDDAGAQHIWVETPPSTPEWEGVRDRLQRAAAASTLTRR